MSLVHDATRPRFLHRYALLYLAAVCLAACMGVNPKSASAASTSQSISKWTSCTGVSDDAQGVARAFAAASHGAFTLVVDCALRLHIGTDIARTIFIDDGTTVVFTAAGKFTVDNVFHPAFAIANSKDITLTNWNVEYDASLPVDSHLGGYENDGKAVTAAGYAQPAAAFNDSRVTPWLTAKRAITFYNSADRGHAIWVGPTNTSAVFYLTGDTSNVSVTGMRLYVPKTAGGDRFIPMAFSLSQNYKSNQTLAATTPLTADNVAVPHNLLFSGIDLDGTYMGWQGNARDVTFENIRSHRYGDLQDAAGANVGGVGKWFAPPHLFYLNYSTTGDPALFNMNIKIHNVVDDGTRIGVARDKGGSDSASGNALSLKIGCVDCTVDGYQTSRPDGFLDVLPSNGLTISNVNATYDSSFLNNIYPGWRFPSSSYAHITFDNIALTDSAATTTYAPIGSSNQPSNDSIVFRNVRVSVNQWAGKGSLLPTILGQNNAISLAYSIRATASRLDGAQQGTVGLTFLATPTTLPPGAATTLTWTSRGASSCGATGGWTGPLPTNGSRAMPLASAGNNDFALLCKNATDSVSDTLHIVVSP